MINTLKVREELDNNFKDSYSLDVAAGEFPILLVISDKFSGKNRDSRLALIEPLLSSAGFGKDGILDLYTASEAADRSIVLPPLRDQMPSSWQQAVSLIESGIKPKSQASTRKFRRIVFYSYKGGVGRTTSLVHTAFLLARAGRRVAIVDMDVEAPGVHVVLPPPDGKAVSLGLVDYLWERQTRPHELDNFEGFETCVTSSGENKSDAHAIAYFVEDSESRAQICVIPAGVPCSEYVRRLHALSSQEVLSHSDDAWSIFERDLLQQFEPDIVLIDARTGLGDWGGLSLLRLADEAFLILYPSEQNLDGLRFVRKILTQVSTINTHLVLSPVPDGSIGRELMARFEPKLELAEDEEPVRIFYNPGIGAADRYPVESAIAGYARLAGSIGESLAQDRVEEVFQKVNSVAIIESLSFPQRDAKSVIATEFDQFFQKTQDFERFLDDARWAVRGRKGTGKSTLFHLFVDHRDIAAKRARGRLEGVEIIPGHGPVATADFRPTTDVFGDIAEAIQRDQRDWLSLWRAYALIRISMLDPLGVMDSALAGSAMKPLREHLRQNFVKNTLTWRDAHTQALLKMLDTPLNGLCRDLFGDINGILERQGKKLWLLYDDLDQDFEESSNWKSDALGGLLRLAYDANNQGLHNIRCKIFLREDIWDQLVFTNKSHFGPDRTLTLEWKIVDFLRLAYRMAGGGSPQYRMLAQKEFPMGEEEIDTASEEDLQKVLAPLWGLRKEKAKNQTTARWVYSRMTDAANNTYPRSLAILLDAARNEELESRKIKSGSRATGTDRLLGPPAMLSGLKAASAERVNALKNEFPRLKTFLEKIEKGQGQLLRSQFSTDELTAFWKTTASNAHQDFGSFLNELKQSGLLVEKKKGGTTYDFGIASLYIDGLNIQRVQGEKK